MTRFYKYLELKKYINNSEQDTDEDDSSLTPNLLREKLKMILDTFDSLSRQAGIVDKDTLLFALHGKVEIPEALELIDYLVKEGILQAPRPDVLEKS